MKGKLLVLAAVLVLAGVLVPSAASAHSNYIWHIPGTHPIVFLHGGSGSASQFESQAMRFEQNGYPHEYVNVLEYDSSLQLETMEDIWARLDQLIADIEVKTGDDQVDLMGHSMGGEVAHGYIESSPERAAKIARYVTFDSGSSCGADIPAGVPTLAIWADNGFHVGCSMTGATNVVISNCGHVQAASSADSFVAVYKYLTGFPPLTKYILPQILRPIELAGRAVIFQKNTGVAGATLEIWEVNRNTGARIGANPKAVYTLGADGAWGPFKAKLARAYEFNLVREGQSPHPFYYEPFIRSDYLIRLNTSPEPGGGVSGYMDRSANHVNLVLGRNMELWGDQGANNDILEVNGVNVISPATNYVTKQVNIMFVFDKLADGITHLGVPLYPYHALGFFTAVDVYVPGAYPANGTTSLALTSRLGGGITRVINVPNLASSQVRRISVQFNDYDNPWPWP